MSLEITSSVYIAIELLKIFIFRPTQTYSLIYLGRKENQKERVGVDYNNP